MIWSVISTNIVFGMRVHLLKLSNDDLEQGDNLRTIAEMVVLHTRHLCLAYTLHRRPKPWEVKSLLKHCSSKLEVLTINFSVLSRDDTEEEQEQEAIETAEFLHLNAIQRHSVHGCGSGAVRWSD